jgi:hypothetical protein
MPAKMTLAHAVRRQHALQGMMTALPSTPDQYLNRLVGRRLRLQLLRLRTEVSAVLRRPDDLDDHASVLTAAAETATGGEEEGGEGQAGALHAAMQAVSAAVVASRRAALYRSGPEGHRAWHGAQLWSPMTLVHALLQLSSTLQQQLQQQSAPAAPAAAAAARSSPSCCLVAIRCCSKSHSDGCSSRPGSTRSRCCHRLRCSCRRSATAGCLPAATSRALSLLSRFCQAHRWYRTARLVVGVIGAAVLSWAIAPALNGALNAFWAPVTVAFIAGGSESGSYRTVVQRLYGTLLGSSVGLLAGTLCHQRGPLVLALQSGSAAGGTAEFVAAIAPLAVWLALWSAALHFSRPGGPAAYWATVAAFTAPVVAINGIADVALTQAFAVARMEMTWLGLAVYYLVTLAMPVSARLAVQRGFTTAIEQLNSAAEAAAQAYCALAPLELQLRDGGYAGDSGELQGAGGRLQEASGQLRAAGPRPSESTGAQTGASSSKALRLDEPEVAVSEAAQDVAGAQGIAAAAPQEDAAAAEAAEAAAEAAAVAEEGAQAEEEAREAGASTPP